MAISASKAMKEVYDNNGGEFPGYTFPGRYPIAYIDRDGCIFCGTCASNLDSEFDAPIISSMCMADSDDGVDCEQCNEHMCAYGCGYCSEDNE